MVTFIILLSNLVKCNTLTAGIKKKSRSVKQTYFSLIRSILEFACVIWDPPQSYLEQKLKKFQNQALRFGTGD